MQGKTQFKLKREMSAGALEGRVMKMLCAISRAKTVLEVGMFTGTSALAMAEIIPADGKVRTPDKPAKLPKNSDCPAWVAAAAPSLRARTAR